VSLGPANGVAGLLARVRDVALRHKSAAAAVAGVLAATRVLRWIVGFRFVDDLLFSDHARHWLLGHWSLVAALLAAVFAGVFAVTRFGLDWLERLEERRRAAEPRTVEPDWEQSGAGVHGIGPAWADRPDAPQPPPRHA
jgi:hypothetical protein